MFQAGGLEVTQDLSLVFVGQGLGGPVAVIAGGRGGA